jgi:hypothetical protein
MMRRFWAFVVVTVVIGAFAMTNSVAFAQGAAARACNGDIQAFCAGVPHGDGKIVQCLRDHQQQLSPGCQADMQRAAGLMKEVVSACEDDVHRYCAGAAPGTTRECLRTNFRELSMGCKRELFEAKKAM